MARPLPFPRLTRRFLPLLLLMAGAYYSFTTLTAVPRVPRIPFEDPLPLISLVSVFNGGSDKLPASFPYFLDSVARQPHALEWTMIQRNGCSDLRAWTKEAGNIKHVCLSEDKFWKAHTDYFCQYWGGCTRKQGKQMLEDMKTFGRVQNPQSVYPILRGWVFRKYLNTKATYWGFCDLDTFMGDFSQTFPYDQASNDYDVIIPTEPSEAGGERLIFMRGHLTLLRNTPETQSKIMRYEYFRSFEAWEEMGVPQSCIEEAEYSHFVVGEPRINILAFDGMMPTVPVRSSSVVGLLSLPDTLLPPKGKAPSLKPNVLRALTTPSIYLPKHPSFTELGLRYPVQILQGEAPPKTGLWFDETFVSWYKAQPVPRPKNVGSASQGTVFAEKWRRYLIKKDNEWTERLEPKREFRGNYKDGGLDHAYQWLYAHWQEDKRQAHWRNIPQGAPADIFMIYQNLGNAAFDAQTGRRQFWLEKKEEVCSSFGCVDKGEVPIVERETWKHFISTASAFADWYSESKAIRLGHMTGTIGPDPSKPTA